MAKVRPIPEGYHAVTPNLVIRDAAVAIDFYKKAFGASELMRKLGPGGKITHGEIKIGDSIVFICDEFPDMGCKSVQGYGGSPVGMYLYVPDVDATFKAAVAAGAAVKMAPNDAFWGDRYAYVNDPFGISWSIATHVEDVSPEEMERRAAAFFSKKQG
jgi:PhnB protein